MSLIFRCLEDIISFEVSETVRVGEVVGHVTSYFSPSLYYQLADTDDRPDFIVNPSTGDIIVQHPLDFETKHLYNLTIVITNLVSYSSK